MMYLVIMCVLLISGVYLLLSERLVLAVLALSMALWLSYSLITTKDKLEALSISLFNGMIVESLIAFFLMSLALAALLEARWK